MQLKIDALKQAAGWRDSPYLARSKRLEAGAPVPGRLSARPGVGAPPPPTDDATLERSGTP